jgi:hypothetical protein
MSIIRANRPPVKPTRRTARPSAPFGAGLFPKRTRFEPSEADRQWAAQVFGAAADWDVRMVEGDQPQPDYDMLAGEAEYIVSVENLGPPPAAGICKKFSEPSEALSWRMCPACFDDAATDAAIACVNSLYGLGCRVF